MATLQKFKLLATQCAVAGSPTRSPTASPVIHIRRRKTLRMLLSRSGSGNGQRAPRRDGSPDRPGKAGDSPEESKELAVRHKLKDLFVSSPPPEDRGQEKVRDPEEALLPASAGAVRGGSGFLGGAGRRGGPRTLRPLSVALRQRLLRRAWRPVLVAVPE